MSHESRDELERQIAAIQPLGAPRELRAAVLGNVARELHAARWDRRLARAAAVLIVIGVGLNFAVGMQPDRFTNQRLRFAHPNPRQSLLDTAVVVAEATDAQTGNRFARQLAEMMGQKLTADEAAAIEAATHSRRQHGRNGNRG